ncbi:hypothetical protein CEP51_016681 [Fusarium floridanum]|uniref:Uncharacterized protein n=1 Tax=Fusarium floridanum TaxID=1325733 RepID=A0A428NIE5_9HYPO|nr:hypothetical protein CEP51_016681 [Fusarium floridanum]
MSFARLLSFTGFNDAVFDSLDLHKASQTRSNLDKSPSVVYPKPHPKYKRDSDQWFFFELIVPSADMVVSPIIPLTLESSTCESTLWVPQVLIPILQKRLPQQIYQPDRNPFYFIPH